jgi:hypothetical protein
MIPNSPFILAGDFLTTGFLSMAVSSSGQKAETRAMILQKS